MQSVLASQRPHTSLPRCTCQATPQEASTSRPSPAHHSHHQLTRRTAFASLAASVLALSRQVSAAETAPTVYFGNGCFWGRQKDFYDTEKKLGRDGENISAVAGYAGGADQGKRGLVCYYYGPRDSIYDSNGHAEVVQLELDADSSKARRQMEMFADTYFKQFRKTPMGMMRLDPQDFGPAYRNVIGIPGGTASPLYEVLKARNVNKMQLIPGQGNSASQPSREGDAFNKIFILDSDKLPFHQAEVYHQYHNSIGVPFGPDYTRKQKQAAQEAGRVYPTGCPEF